MTILETVALEQRRWGLTARHLKDSNFARFRLMVGLTLAGGILEALTLQIYTLHPTASQVSGYAGAAALAMMLVVRSRGLRAERVQAWVLALAASQSLKTEMYQYRTSTGPYSDNLCGNPEATLLERRDNILAKVRSIQKYAVEPSPKPMAPLGALDADAYVSERVNTEISTFRKFIEDLPKIQSSWLKLEYFLAVAGTLLAVVLTLTHNQAYGAWVVVITTLSLASGVSAKAERYATLIIGHRAMPDRLTGILEQWRTNRGTLDQLVEQIEAAVLAESQAWVIGTDRFLKESALPAAGELRPKLTLHSPVSRTGA
jgi:Protein of unknown function (DUF4231)/SMODS and SLOG-associating 2TM effector domain 1